MKLFLFTFIIASFTCLYNCFAQDSFNSSSKEGLVNVTFLNPQTNRNLGAHAQNLSILQGNDNRIYAANVNGVLVYNSSTWKLISVGNRVVYSLAKNKKGKIFVGAQGDLGYLKPDSIGQIKFISLKESIPKENQDFSLIWNTITHKNKVYFQSTKYLFCWENNSFKIWNSDKGFHRIYKANNQIFIKEKKSGLKILKNEKLNFVKSYDQIKDYGIYAILPFNKKSVIVATSKNGLFVYDGQIFKPIETKADKHFKEFKIYKGVVTPDNKFAFTFIKKGGAIVINKKGKIVHNFSQGTGLKKESINGLFFDKRNQLWLAMDKGIVKLEYNFPMSFYNEKNGLKGNSRDMLKHKGKLYCATSHGVFYLNNNKKKFIKINNLNAQCFDLEIVNGDLIIAARDGIYKIVKNNAIRIYKDNAGAILALRHSKIDSLRMYLSSGQSVQAIRFKNKKWIKEKVLASDIQDVYKILETKNGNLWLQTYVPLIYKLNFPDIKSSIEKATLNSYSQEDGVPNDYFQVHNFGESQIFDSEKNIYKFNTRDNKFEVANNINDYFKLPTEAKIISLFTQPNQNVCFLKYLNSDDKENYIINAIAFKNNKGTYKLKNLQFNDFQTGTLIFPYIENKNIVWLGAQNHLVRLDNRNQNAGLEYPLNIEKVIIKDNSVIYAGHNKVKQPPIISYDNNTISFNYAASWYENERETLYQYKLLENNNSSEWSSWSKETKNKYTNLWEGNYELIVRAKNIYNELSEEASFKFEILAPWYRSWYAYAFYLLLGGTFVWGVSYIRSMQLKRVNEVLESKVQQRTIEVREQASMLENQAEELKVQAQRLQELDTLKSRLFANISHEFRTPLTLIISPIEKKLNNFESELKKSDFQLIHRNAYQLLRLINQLLDLAKLESSKIKTRVSKNDLLGNIRTLCSSFCSFAETKKIDYQIKIDSINTKVYFDGEKIEKVINNLLSNAFKFTPENGTISVNAHLYAEDKDGHLKLTGTDYLFLEVKDNGIGIPEETLEKIFDRFYQIDSSHTRHYEGTGIGLALTKELIKLHKGDIEVESKEGSGCTFKVNIPVNKSFYNEEEIVLEEEIFEENNLNEYLEIKPEFSENEETSESQIDNSEPLLLVVDDNQDIRNYIKDSVNEKYRCIEAVDGQEGIKKASEVVPDIIISDLMMPNMDGLTFCKHIKTDKTTSHIPVILLTAKANVEAKIEGLQTGADDYITKPFNVDELLVRTENLLAQRKKLKALFSEAVYLKPEEITVNDKDKEFLKNALQIVEDHIADAYFGVPVLEKELGLSRMQLHRKLKAMIGQPPGEFIKSIKLKRAAQLLATKSLSVSEVAYDTGFSDPSYFTKVFRKQFGVPPTEYNEKS